MLKVNLSISVTRAVRCNPFSRASYGSSPVPLLLIWWLYPALAAAVECLFL